MRYHCVWLIWSSAFRLPWITLYLLNPRLRAVIWRTRAATALLGLTEPLFVPVYWNPPSLFELAQRTGFDIESLIYAFAIGGVGPSSITHSPGSIWCRSAPRNARIRAIGSIARLARAVRAALPPTVEPDLPSHHLPRHRRRGVRHLPPGSQGKVLIITSRSYGSSPSEYAWSTYWRTIRWVLKKDPFSAMHCRMMRIHAWRSS